MEQRQRQQHDVVRADRRRIERGELVVVGEQRPVLSIAPFGAPAVPDV